MNIRQCKKKSTLLLNIADKLGSLDTSKKEYDKTMEKMRQLSEKEKERVIFLLSSDCLALRSVLRGDIKIEFPKKKKKNMNAP